MPSALQKPIVHNVMNYLGEQTVPPEIRRRRKMNLETMRRMGTPVLIKHMYNIDDVSKGIATESANFSTVYRESTHADPLSYGVGYVSTETQEGEWYDEKGQIHIAPVPEPTWKPAPRYRGYGPGYLTYAVLPDAPEDVFKMTGAGTLMHTQIARAQLPWWPYCGDNDLLIVCDLDHQFNIIATHARYELKKVTPITMRGRDNRGRTEFSAPNLAGNRYWIGQYCELSKVLETDPTYLLETDR